MISSLRDLSYTERLKELDLPTLKYRRFRGDLIHVYKIIQQVVDLKFYTFFTPTKSGHKEKQNTNCMLNTVKQMLESSPLAIELHKDGKYFR